jgi:hypothetical protein
MATLAVLDGAEEEFSAEEAAPGADLAESADAGLLKDLIDRSDRLIERLRTAETATGTSGQVAAQGLQGMLTLG